MSENQTVFIYAPVSGKTIDITKVPDEVFAQKMVGDGIAIEPDSSLLLAPADGVIENIHSSCHALTLTTPQGIAVLMHIGLETVRLKGKGFDVKVKSGQAVKKGDTLIEFDLDYIREHAKSALSVIVVTNPEKVRTLKTFDDKKVKSARDVIMELALAGEKNNVSEKDEDEHTALSWGIRIVNESGIHARPAAVLANAAKKYKSEIYLNRGEERVNAKSLVALMEADLKKGQEVTLFAKGTDAVDALEELMVLLDSGLGENAQDAPEEQAETQETATQKERAERSSETLVRGNVFNGVGASDGIAVGQIVCLEHEAFDIPEVVDSPEIENEKLTKAFIQAKEQLQKLYEETVLKTGEAKAAVFLAHIELLDDPELLEKTNTLIGKGKSAAYAFHRSVEDSAKRLLKMKNKLLANRASDLRDVSRRVVGILLKDRQKIGNFPENTILIAQELTPSQAAGLDTRKIAGFATVRGGATSHAAILARALAIPAIVGLPEDVLNLSDGTRVLLNGTTGELILNPDDNIVRKAGKERQKELEKQGSRAKNARLPAKTTDGFEIEVAGNISGIGEVENLLKNGGCGVGLLRSEFLFADRSTPPSFEEQEKIYADIATALGKERVFVVRTLDAGGDKPLSYLKMPQEDNPFLGVRGIRLSLMNPEIFKTQIRAVLKSAGKAKIRLLFPMITCLFELEEAQQIVENEARALGVPEIETGIMIEVPAAAAMADVFARKVDFFSIGTNDLSQYVLAADRGNANVSTLADAYNPAVLRMIKATVDGAKKHKKPVAVCGNMASEELAVPLLIGLGVEELSVTVPVISKIKECVRRLDMKKCQEFAKTALSMESADQVRQETRAFLARFNKEGEI